MSPKDSQDPWRELAQILSAPSPKVLDGQLELDLDLWQVDTTPDEASDAGNLRRYTEDKSGASSGVVNKSRQETQEGKT